MKRTILAAVLLACTALATPASAEFILNDETFADLGATGFGNAPRLLTLQNAPFENGAVVSVTGTQTFLNNISIGPSPGFVVTGDVCTSNGTCTTGLRTGSNESRLVNVTSLWTSGAQVGVGLDQPDRFNRRAVVQRAGAQHLQLDRHSPRHVWWQ